MKELEIIKKLIELSPNENVVEFTRKNEFYNLSVLCVKDNKYLTDENLNLILNNKIKPYKATKIVNYDEANLFQSSNIAYLISNYPELFDEISSKIIKNLDQDDWTTILKKQPELVTKCNILDDIRFINWKNILAEQPQLLPNYKNFYNLIDKGSLAWIVINNQKIINYLDIKQIKMFRSYDRKHIYNVLGIIEAPKYKPNLILKHITSCDSIELAKIISIHPEIINKFNLNLTGKLNVDDWVTILKKQPQLIEKCDKVNEISSLKWNLILYEKPELIEYCNKKLKGDVIYKVLINHPNAIEKLNIHDTNYEKDVEEIVYNSKEYHKKAIEQYIKKYHDIYVLTTMIYLYPDLKELYTEKDLWKYVDFNKLSDNLEYGILK